MTLEEERYRDLQSEPLGNSDECCEVCGGSLTTEKFTSEAWGIVNTVYNKVCKNCEDGGNR